jgi:hypothetical protein
MKRFVTVSLLILMLVPAALAAARHASTGIGFQIGEPTALSAKFWLSSRNAIDAALGWNLVAEKFTVQAGYLWHFPQSVRSGSFALYVGVGGILGGGSSRDTGEGEALFGVRVPLGLEYIIRSFGLYAQLDPRVNLLPGIGPGLGGGIGFRFYLR